jgi:hypothetical protein
MEDLSSGPAENIATLEASCSFRCFTPGIVSVELFASMSWRRKSRFCTLQVLPHVLPQRFAIEQLRHGICEPIRPAEVDYGEYVRV